MEIGIRKTFGATNGTIRGQLLSESVLLAIIVLPIALILTMISLPLAGKLFQTKLSVISSNIDLYTCVYVTLVIVIGIVSGLYTSSFLSRQKVICVFKSTITSGKRKQFLRSVLIVLQLVIFCSFVSATLIIHSQYTYALHKDLGYSNKDILMVDLGYDFKSYSAFINNINENPNVIMSAGVMNGLPMMGSSTMMVSNFKDKAAQIRVEVLSVGFNYLKTMGIKVQMGREFSENFGSDLKQSFILNETAVKKLDIIDPIGKQIFDHSIIGVVGDFNLHSIHSDIPPMIIEMTDQFINQVAVCYKPGTLKDLLPKLETEWKKVAPDRPFHFTTIEEQIKSLYSSERNLSKIVFIFALFIIIIAAFGLFGLTLFISQSRKKEIGIKKAFGSSEGVIIFSFLLNNLILVSLSAIFSVPITLYIMTKWLDNFAYKTGINCLVFFISFGIAIVIVLSTIFIHSYKASLTNPVDVLRYE